MSKEALQLPAPRDFENWRVLREDEKHGKATGEEMFLGTGAMSMGLYHMQNRCRLSAYKTVIVPPDYGKKHFDDCREIDCEYDKLDKDTQKRLCALDYTDVEFRHAYTSRWISCLETGHFAQGYPSGEIIYRQKRKEAQQEPERNEDGDSVSLARKFHKAYERLAPQFGYETREETREFDPESPNGKLMIAVCSEILDLTAMCVQPERNEDEQETAKPALPITHIACRVEGSSADVMMDIREVKLQMKGVE
jgi:hypothetical protein